MRDIPTYIVELPLQFVMYILDLPLQFKCLHAEQPSRYTDKISPAITFLFRPPDIEVFESGDQPRKDRVGRRHAHQHGEQGSNQCIEASAEVFEVIVDLLKALVERPERLPPLRFPFQRR
jgi:hypothetical protein